ncbi:MAG: hypothetical protein LKE92_11005 [Atopobiaceae bacterium]|nr:hypothetical protein [Atopobiaceae bacterium]
MAETEAALSLYVYTTFADGTEVVYSGAFIEDCKKKAIVHFERPTDEGFDSIRCELPAYRWIPWEGKFSDEELACFDAFIHERESLFMQPVSTTSGERIS